MDILLLISLLMCMAASLPAATYSHSQDAHEKRDLDALLSFRKAITSDPLGMLSNWTAENSHNICSWYGIRCKKYTTRVVAIDFLPSWPSKITVSADRLHRHRNDLSYEGAGLKGTLSSSLSSLSLLHRLDLSGNSFMGRIPPEFGHLKALRVLDLRYNAMNGSIPAEIGQLKALRVLRLELNMLSGSIPAELGLLQKLENLTLDYNYFSGLQLEP